MQHAPKHTHVGAGPALRTAGVDWARDDHVVAVVAAQGEVAERFTVPHTAEGLRHLVRRLAKLAVDEVAVERPDGSATVTLRAACRARKDLVVHRVALANQLRAHLQRAFPGAVDLFADLDSPISLRFLERFDCQDGSDWLSPKRMAAWLVGVGYCGRVAPETIYARLAAAPRGATGVDGAAQAHVTRALLATLGTLVEQIKIHAVRILARAWLFVIWHCWQTQTPYEPARHGALRALLAQAA